MIIIEFINFIYFFLRIFEIAKQNSMSSMKLGKPSSRLLKALLVLTASLAPAQASGAAQTSSAFDALARFREDLTQAFCSGESACAATVKEKTVVLDHLASIVEGSLAQGHLIVEEEQQDQLIQSLQDLHDLWATADQTEEEEEIKHS